MSDFPVPPRTPLSSASVSLSTPASRRSRALDRVAFVAGTGAIRRRFGILRRGVAVPLCAALLLGAAGSVAADEGAPSDDPGRAVASDSSLDPTAGGPSDDGPSDRERFVAARRALAAGNRADFLALEATLVDYPLHHWLVHERLKERWRRETPTLADLATVEAFEAASDDPALTGRLVRTLQERFAQSGRWQDYLALQDSPYASRTACGTLRASEALDPATAFDAETLALWTSAEPLDSACSKAIAALERRARAAGAPPPVGAQWERVYAAMDAGRFEAAESVIARFGNRDRRLVERWIAGRNGRPVQQLASGALDTDTPLNRRIIADLVLAWSREDTLAAVRYWEGARERFAFSDELAYDTHRALIMRGAYRRMPEAAGWLEAFEGRADDLELAEWRIRAALLGGDWDQVMRGIRRLPPEEQAEDHWAYWEARALERDGEEEIAREIYTRLAALQSWHGFLSAERVGLPHSIEDVPIRPSAELRARLEADPALRRAREYHHVDLKHEGRREWNDWLAEHGSEEIAVAAVLASEWGLDDRAIFSAGRADRRRALSLRFPTLYAERVLAESRENRLEPAWVHGVMRRESAYIADIRSSAGAIGLMQLMPGTAQDVARWRGEENWRGDLTDPDTNIAFGAYYLRHVLDRFDDHQVLATASYNAGPHRVAGWLPEKGAMEADRWIDTIPFTETRRYVRAVLAYAAIYQQRLEGEPYDLSVRLRPVPSKEGDSASLFLPLPNGSAVDEPVSVGAIRPRG